MASFPDSNFTISALDRLEAVSGISVYKHLASKLPAMVSAFFTDKRDMFQEWISRVHPPTWQTLLGVLLSIDHPLAKAIEDFLQPKTQTASPVQLLLLFTSSYGITLCNPIFSNSSCGREKKRNTKSNQKVGSLCQERIRAGGSSKSM